MTALETLAAVERNGVVLILRSASPAAALATVEAARAGGVTTVEVTYSVPGAEAVIRELAPDTGLLVGAGTVLSARDAARAIEAGASFIVSPGIDDGAIAEAVAADVLVVPGTYTVSEMLRALDLGAPAVKLFPAAQAGPDYLAALRAPLPDLRCIPSGGVSAETAGDWIAAGAVAVGVGGALSPKDPSDDDLRGVTATAARIIDAVSTARAEGARP